MDNSIESNSAIAGDDRPAFRLLLSCPRGLSSSQVSVDFSEVYDRIPHSDVTLENSISEIWDQRVQKNGSLFNGLKFRYGVHVFNNSGGSSQEAHVCLHLGLTDYRTFVGTNLNPLWERFLLPSEGYKSDVVPHQMITNSVGIHQVLLAMVQLWRHLTKNYLFCNEVIMLGNFLDITFSQEAIQSLTMGKFGSQGVGRQRGRILHPEEIGITSHHIRDTHSHQVINKMVSQEMFDSIIREVVEEIGVPANTLISPTFIGISRRLLNVRPTAFFFMKCSLNSMEIQQRYCSASDSYESTQLYAVSMADLELMTPKMPGCHQGGYALFKLMVEAVMDT